jgi:hypothetical protein
VATTLHGGYYAQASLIIFLINESGVRNNVRE